MPLKITKIRTIKPLLFYAEVAQWQTCPQLLTHQHLQAGQRYRPSTITLNVITFSVEVRDPVHLRRLSSVGRAALS